MTQKWYVVRHGDSDTSDRYFDKEHFETNQSLYDFRFKRYGSNSGFRVFGDLDLDRCSIFFVTRIAHDVLEYPCEVSLESVQYELVICCG